MTFDKYQKQSRKTAIYPQNNKMLSLLYLTAGLAGESGEVAEKMKKILRDDNSKITFQKKQEIKKELGDVLWYVAQFATELDLNFSDIAEFNLKKLFSRKDRKKLKGSGDNR